MAQEVSITLKADTREAVRSVQELEKHVAGLDNLQRKGQSEGNFLTQDDVKRFRRMAEDTERIYQQFYEKMNRVQRDLEKKKTDLEQATKRGAGQSTTQQLEREIKELEARRNIYQSQKGYIENQRQHSQQTTGNINDMNQPGMMANMLMMSRRLMPLLGVTLGAGALFGFARQGMQQIKVDESYMSQLGQRVPGYSGDFEKGRLEATEVGLKDGNAYKALDTMQVAQNYSSLAGSRSIDEMWKATNEIQTTGRVMGLDPSELSSQIGQLASMGAIDYKTISAFREGMVGAIKETGMAGRDREFVNAVSGLSQQVGRGQMELDNSEFGQILGLQTLLGRTGLKGLQGEEGANLLGQLDSGVKGNDAAVDIMLGWGTKFNGPQGRAELERMKGRGISDPELLKELFGNIGNLYGGDKDQQALWIKDKFGISMEQADALLQDDVMSQLQGGGLSKEQIEKIMESGKAESSKRQGEWQGSQAQRRANNEAEKEDLSKDMGSPLDKLWEGTKDMFFSQPDWLQATELMGGVAAGGFFGAKGLSALGKKFGGKPVGANATPKSGAAGKAKGLLKGGSKLLGPLGFLASADLATDAGNGLGDWFFGHSKGMPKAEGLFSNPFDAPELYENDRQGALSKAWDWATPWDTGSEKKKAEAEKLDINKIAPDAIMKTTASAGLGLSNGATASRLGLAGSNKAEQEELLGEEAGLVDGRKSSIEAMHVVLDKEKKNIDELKNIYGVEKISAGGGEKKGFFGSLLDGVKNLFSGGSNGVVSASYANNSYAATGVSNSEYLNQNLKKKSDLSAEDINKWIASKAGSDSLMLGKGAEFLKASQNSGLDARYLVAHAGLETGWGDPKNGYAKDGNWFGIGAFDHNPDNAKKYGGGIGFGANWIAENYVNKGQDTVHKMRNNGGVHQYATDPLWDDKIASIMASGPAGNSSGALNTASAQTLNVNVSGNIAGLTKENNDLVAQAVASKVKTSNNVQLAYEFKQGIGGLV